jgi:hypothetical protein
MRCYTVLICKYLECVHVCAAHVKLAVNSLRQDEVASKVKVTPHTSIYVQTLIYTQYVSSPCGVYGIFAMAYHEM